MTVNEAINLLKMLRERISELRSLRSTVAVKERFFSTTEKVVEPQYDVKLVDRKVSQLEVVVFKLDSAIKASNAKTELDFVTDVDQLLEPLQ